jgi:MazG family protein
MNRKRESGSGPKAFDRLCQIIRRLRAPGGCSWDRKQTPRTLRANLIEEAWECVSAIDAEDDGNLEEELGDLYMLVTLLAWMREQDGAFTIESTLERICAKLVRRHPHVFGDANESAPEARRNESALEARRSKSALEARRKVSSVEQITAQWDAIKAGEKSAPEARRNESAPEARREARTRAPSIFHKVSKSLPPLERALAIQKSAAKVGFDWPAPGPVWVKLVEEISELRAAVERGGNAHVEEELGDLLFTVVNLSRLLKVDPAVALRGTNGKFERRFRAIERRLLERNVRPADAGLDEMDALWNQVKAEESGTSTLDGRRRGPKTSK